MSLTSISVIMAVIVTNIHERAKACSNKENRLPKLMRKILIHKMARFFGMQKQAKKLLKSMIKKSKEKPKNLKSLSTCFFQSNCNDAGSSPSLYEMIANDFRLKQKYDNLIYIDQDAPILLTDNKQESLTWMEKKSFLVKDIKSYSLPNALKMYQTKCDSDKCTESEQEIDNQNYTDLSDVPDLDSDLEEKSKNLRRFKDLNGKNKIKFKSYERLKYKIKRENLSLYFAYEYALAGLVLDRFFFWIYTTSTLLSYIITLYIYPCLVQTNQSQYTKYIP